MKSLILTISCNDRPGIVAEVTKFLFNNRFNIVESGQFNDKYTDNFFMRTEFQLHDKKNLFDENSF
ncbi:MAG: ACT domain-containing protein, partial [Chloroflexota bacterium]|nr:ACT domain-containing protein [Chloroflexota bacterium]